MTRCLTRAPCHSITLNSGSTAGSHSKKQKVRGDIMGGYTARQSLAGLKVAILGAGKMGGILLQAFLKSKVLEPEQILATVEHEERAGQLSAQWGVDVSTDNVAAAGAADLVLIGVKPITVPELFKQIRPSLTPQKLLVSIAASVRTTAIEQAAGME